MATSTVQAVYKLAIAGEQAGFTLEQMIQILNAGVSVETLLNEIELPLGGVDPEAQRLSRRTFSPTTSFLKDHQNVALQQGDFQSAGSEQSKPHGHVLTAHPESP